METLKHKILVGLPLKDFLIRIADVVNFEGPLLTLFENSKNRQLYLFDWVDRDQVSNRWVVYRTTSKKLLHFIQGNISHKELFQGIDHHCFVVDIDGELNYRNVQSVLKEKLPLSYIPNDDVYFEEEDCPHFNKLKAFLTNAPAATANLIIVDSHKPNWKTAIVSHRKAPRTNRIAYRRKNLNETAANQNRGAKNYPKKNTVNYTSINQRNPFVYFTQF